MLLAGCGFHSPLAGLQRATGLASPTPTLDAGQQMTKAVLQRLFDLLNATQHDGSTTLTTKITARGHTGGHANTALDYALNRVDPPDATLNVNWHFTDPITNTNVSGDLALYAIRVDLDHNLNGGPGNAHVSYSYRETTSDSKTYSGSVIQAYYQDPRSSEVKPTTAPPPSLDRQDRRERAKLNQDPGSIHVPIAAISRAVRAGMTVPEALTARADQQVADVQSAIWEGYGPGDYPNVPQVTPGSGGNPVRCGLPRGFDGGPLIGSLNVEVGSMAWGVPEGQEAGPGLHPNQSVVLLGEPINTATVVVNPDLRSGSIQASESRGVRGGTKTVSGRWVCPPSSVTGGVFA
jgi:hypothetical protein